MTPSRPERDDLFSKMLDGTIADGELAALDQLLRDDAAARLRWSLFCDLEGGLAEWSAAMPTAKPATAPSVRPAAIAASRIWRMSLASACLAILAALALVVGFWQARPTFENAAPILVQCSSDVQVSSIDAAAGQAIPRGASVEVRDEDGVALIQYPDGTRIELFGNTRVVVTTHSSGVKQVRLLDGNLRADVTAQHAGRPMILTTPHGEVRVTANRVQLAAQNDQGTRVDVDRGQAELARGEESPIMMTDESFAFIPAGDGPVVVKASPQVERSPARSFIFPGLESIAYADDSATLVGVAARHRVSWYANDRSEAIPLRMPSDRPARLVLAKGQIASLAPQAGGGDGAHWHFLRREFFSIPNRPSESRLAAVSSTGQWAATWRQTPSRNIVDIWNGAAEPVVVASPAAKVNVVESTPDGTGLVIGRRLEHKEGYVIDIIDPATGACQSRYPIKENGPYSAGFSGDGRLLAVGMVGVIQVWDVAGKTRQATYSHPDSATRQVALSQDGMWLAASGTGHRVWLWHRGGEEQERVLSLSTGARQLAFSPDGQQLAVLDGDGRVTVWSLEK